MKGLILCAGKGTRMRPITYSLPKQLIPVANRPVIHYAFESFRQAGITELGIVVSDNRKDIEPLLGDGAEWGMTFTYIDQPETRGIAHAVLCAEEFVGDDTFLLYLGDNLLEKGVGGLVDAYHRGGQDAAIMLKEVPEPQHFGVAEVKGDKIVSIKEKPRKPKSNLAVIGVYIFNPKVFEAAKSIKPSARGELEITDTISKLIEMGCEVTHHVVDGWWKDTGQKSDMIEANRALLNAVRGVIEGKVDGDSVIEGEVIVDAGAEVTGSRISGPAIIGRESRIVNSYIGPYTSIGDNVRVENSEIENSIVMSGATISGLDMRIESSLIGRKARIEKTAGRPRAADIVVGDLCRLALP